MNVNHKLEIRRLIKLAKESLKNRNREQYTYAIAKSRFLCGDTKTIVLDESSYDRALKRLNESMERTGVGK